MRRLMIVTTLLILLVSPICLIARAADDDVALTAYRDGLLAQLDKIEATLPDITLSAEAAADRLLAGGNLYIAGQRGFISEACGRAGGLMMAGGCKAKVPLTAKDVLFIGAGASDDADTVNTCKRAAEAGAYVVLFAPKREASNALPCAIHIDNCAAPGESRLTGDTNALYDVTAMWTYTAELVAALTRKGKMPVIWQSVVLPGGRDRNKRFTHSGDPATRRFHTDATVPPLAAGSMGRAFLDVTRRQLAGLRGHALAQLADTAELMARSVRAGGTVHVQTISHFTSYEVAESDALKWISTDCEARLHGRMDGAKLAALMKPGDVFFQLGYYHPTSHPYHDDAGYVEQLRTAGAKTIIALCHAPAAPLTGPQPDILIDAQWDYGDAAVALPGYDAQILPTSGILQTVVFRTVVAKTESLLRQGK